MNKKTARKTFNLDEIQKNELYKRYYAGEPTKKLIEDFSLHGLYPSQITYLFDNIVTNIKCKYCHVFMERKPHARTSSENNTICNSCGHTIYKRDWISCTCENCLNLRASTVESKQKKIEDGICKTLDFEYEKEQYKASELSGWEKLLLGALISFTIDEELKYIQPLNDIERPFFPNYDKSIEILKELYNEGIIILGNRYRPSSFTLDEEFVVKSFMVDKCFYEIWVDDSNFIKESLSPIKFLTDNQILLFWRDFNKAEGINFLLAEFQKIGINNFTPGKKTEELFATMSEKLSLSQIFRIVKYITNKTAKDILTGEKTYQHIANSTITRMEGYFNRAMYENYSLYNVKYNEDLSMITTYFYNKILKMGDSAFYSVPNLDFEDKTILKQDNKDE